MSYACRTNSPSFHDVLADTRAWQERERRALMAEHAREDMEVDLRAKPEPCIKPSRIWRVFWFLPKSCAVRMTGTEHTSRNSAEAERDLICAQHDLPRGNVYII